MVNNEISEDMLGETGDGSGGDCPETSTTSSDSQTTSESSPSAKEADEPAGSANDDENVRLSPTSLFCSVPLNRDVQTIIDTFPKTEAEKKKTRKIPCLYCDRTFVADNLRQKHVERSHSIKQARRSSSRFQQTTAAVSCLFCNKFTLTENKLSDLFDHLVSAHPGKYFGCLECQERFGSQGQLEEHNAHSHGIRREVKVQSNEDGGDVRTDSAITESSVVKTRHKAKIKEDGEQSDEVKPVVRRGRPQVLHKELRHKKISIKSTKLGIKRSARLQTKVVPAKGKRRPKAKERIPEEPKSEKDKEKEVKVSSTENPYPTFDAFYRVKKITDHSIDNLRITSLTFNDVFDQAFYNRIKCNIRENLLNHLDGKLFKNEESESRISNFEKTQTEQPSSENYGCEISLNAATPVAASLLTAQFGDDPESQIEYGSKASKKKSTPKQDEVHYKYFTRRKYQASILESKENRDLSKLDMWTQLVIKRRQQKIVQESKSDREKLDYKKGEEYRAKKQNQELNRILDRRGPFEDLKEEASKKAAMEGNLNQEAYSDVSFILEDILGSVFNKVTKDVEVKTELTDSEIPSYLNLRKASLTNDSYIDKSDKITLICSSQETENFEAPVTSPKDKNALAELSGEWARSRLYICAACGLKLANMKSLIDHKNLIHQNVWCQHYEFVGNQGEFYKHLSIPGLGKMHKIENDCVHKIWKRSDARACTKCSKQCNSLGELHRHILECGEDWSWMLVRKKCKYKPFGAKTRKKRRGLFKRIIHKEKPADENREKKTYKKEGPRVKPSDADTIERMLANLPAKRATRKIMCLKDGFPKMTRKTNYKKKTPETMTTVVNIKSKKQNMRMRRNRAELLLQQENNLVKGKRRIMKGMKCNPVNNIRKSMRNLNKVISSAIIDNNSTLMVKRKLKNAIQQQRLTRKGKKQPGAVLNAEVGEEKEAQTIVENTKEQTEPQLVEAKKQLGDSKKQVEVKKQEVEVKKQEVEVKKQDAKKQAESKKPPAEVKKQQSEIKKQQGDVKKQLDVKKTNVKKQQPEKKIQKVVKKKQPEETTEVDEITPIRKTRSASSLPELVENLATEKPESPAKKKACKKNKFGKKLMRTLSLRKKKPEIENPPLVVGKEVNVETAESAITDTENTKNNGKRKSRLDSIKNVVKKIRLVKDNQRSQKENAAVGGHFLESGASGIAADTATPECGFKTSATKTVCESECENPVEALPLAEIEPIEASVAIGAQTIGAGGIGTEVAKTGVDVGIEPIEAGVAVETQLIEAGNQEIKTQVDVGIEPAKPEETQTIESGVDANETTKAGVAIAAVCDGNVEEAAASACENATQNNETNESKIDKTAVVPKAKLCKRNKGLNACIAMLTSKLQNKDGDVPVNLVKRKIVKTPVVPVVIVPKPICMDSEIKIKEEVIEEGDSENFDDALEQELEKALNGPPVEYPIPSNDATKIIETSKEFNLAVKAIEINSKINEGIKSIPFNTTEELNDFTRDTSKAELNLYSKITHPEIVEKPNDFNAAVEANKNQFNITQELINSETLDGANSELVELNKNTLVAPFIAVEELKRMHAIPPQVDDLSVNKMYSTVKDSHQINNVQTIQEIKDSKLKGLISKPRDELENNETQIVESKDICNVLDKTKQPKAIEESCLNKSLPKTVKPMDVNKSVSVHKEIEEANATSETLAVKATSKTVKEANATSETAEEAKATSEIIEPVVEDRIEDARKEINPETLETLDQNKPQHEVTPEAVHGSPDKSPEALKAFCSLETPIEEKENIGVELKPAEQNSPRKEEVRLDIIKCFEDINSKENINGHNKNGVTKPQKKGKNKKKQAKTKQNQIEVAEVSPAKNLIESKLNTAILEEEEVPVVRENTSGRKIGQRRTLPKRSTKSKQFDEIDKSIPLDLSSTSSEKAKPGDEILAKIPEGVDLIPAKPESSKSADVLTKPEEVIKKLIKEPKLILDSNFKIQTPIKPVVSFAETNLKNLNKFGFIGNTLIKPIHFPIEKELIKPPTLKDIITFSDGKLADNKPLIKPPIMKDLFIFNSESQLIKPPVIKNVLNLDLKPGDMRPSEVKPVESAKPFIKSPLMKDVFPFPEPRPGDLMVAKLFNPLDKINGLTDIQSNLFKPRSKSFGVFEKAELQLNASLPNLKTNTDEPDVLENKTFTEPVKPLSDSEDELPLAVIAKTKDVLQIPTVPQKTDHTPGELLQVPTLKPKEPKNFVLQIPTIANKAKPSETSLVETIEANKKRIAMQENDIAQSFADFLKQNSTETEDKQKEKKKNKKKDKLKKQIDDFEETLMEHKSLLDFGKKKSKKNKVGESPERQVSNEGEEVEVFKKPEPIITKITIPKIHIVQKNADDEKEKKNKKKDRKSKRTEAMIDVIEQEILRLQNAEKMLKAKKHKGKKLGESDLNLELQGVDILNLTKSKKKKDKSLTSTINSDFDKSNDSSIKPLALTNITIADKTIIPIDVFDKSNTVVESNNFSEYSQNLLTPADYSNKTPTSEDFSDKTLIFDKPSTPINIIDKTNVSENSLKPVSDESGALNEVIKENVSNTSEPVTKLIIDKRRLIAQGVDFESPSKSRKSKNKKNETNKDLDLSKFDSETISLIRNLENAIQDEISTEDKLTLSGVQLMEAKNLEDALLVNENINTALPKGKKQKNKKANRVEATVELAPMEKPLDDVTIMEDGVIKDVTLQNERNINENLQKQDVLASNSNKVLELQEEILKSTQELQEVMLESERALLEGISEPKQGLQEQSMKPNQCLLEESNKSEQKKILLIQEETTKSHEDLLEKQEFKNNPQIAAENSNEEEEFKRLSEKLQKQGYFRNIGENWQEHFRNVSVKLHQQNFEGINAALGRQNNLRDIGEILQRQEEAVRDANETLFATKSKKPKQKTGKSISETSEDAFSDSSSSLTNIHKSVSEEPLLLLNINEEIKSPEVKKVKKRGRKPKNKQFHPEENALENAILDLNQENFKNDLLASEPSGVDSVPKEKPVKSKGRKPKTDSDLNTDDSTSEEVERILSDPSPMIRDEYLMPSPSRKLRNKNSNYDDCSQSSMSSISEDAVKVVPSPSPKKGKKDEDSASEEVERIFSAVEAASMMARDEHLMPSPSRKQRNKNLNFDESSQSQTASLVNEEVSKLIPSPSPKKGRKGKAKSANLDETIKEVDEKLEIEQTASVLEIPALKQQEFLVAESKNNIEEDINDLLIKAPTKEMKISQSNVENVSEDVTKTPTKLRKAKNKKNYAEEIIAEEFSENTQESNESEFEEPLALLKGRKLKEKKASESITEASIPMNEEFDKEKPVPPSPSRGRKAKGKKLIEPENQSEINLNQLTNEDSKKEEMTSLSNEIVSTPHEALEEKQPTPSRGRKAGKSKINQNEEINSMQKIQEEVLILIEPRGRKQKNKKINYNETDDDIFAFEGDDLEKNIPEQQKETDLVLEEVPKVTITLPKNKKQKHKRNASIKEIAIEKNLPLQKRVESEELTALEVSKNDYISEESLLLEDSSKDATKAIVDELHAIKECDGFIESFIEDKTTKRKDEEIEDNINKESTYDRNPLHFINEDNLKANNTNLKQTLVEDIRKTRRKKVNVMKDNLIEKEIQIEERFNKDKPIQEPLWNFMEGTLSNDKLIEERFNEDISIEENYTKDKPMTEQFSENNLIEERLTKENHIEDSFNVDTFIEERFSKNKVTSECFNKDNFTEIAIDKFNEETLSNTLPIEDTFIKNTLNEKRSSGEIEIIEDICNENNKIEEMDGRDVHFVEESSKDNHIEENTINAEISEERLNKDKLIEDIFNFVSKDSIVKDDKLKLNLNEDEEKVQPFENTKTKSTDLSEFTTADESAFIDVEESPILPKGKRPKKKINYNEILIDEEINVENQTVQLEQTTPLRGRKQKNKKINYNEDDLFLAVEEKSVIEEPVKENPTPSKRGRKPKNKKIEETPSVEIPSEVSITEDLTPQITPRARKQKTKKINYNESIDLFDYEEEAFTKEKIDHEEETPAKVSKQKKVDCEEETLTKILKQKKVDCEEETFSKISKQKKVDCEEGTPSKSSKQKKVDCEEGTLSKISKQKNADCEVGTPAKILKQKKADYAAEFLKFAKQNNVDYEEGILLKVPKQDVMNYEEELLENTTKSDEVYGKENTLSGVFSQKKFDSGEEASLTKFSKQKQVLHEGEPLLNIITKQREDSEDLSKQKNTEEIIEIIDDSISQQDKFNAEEAVLEQDLEDAILNKYEDYEESKIPLKTNVKGKKAKSKKCQKLVMNENIKKSEIEGKNIRNENSLNEEAIEDPFSQKGDKESKADASVFEFNDDFDELLEGGGLKHKKRLDETKNGAIKDFPSSKIEDAVVEASLKTTMTDDDDEDNSDAEPLIKIIDKIAPNKNKNISKSPIKTKKQLSNDDLGSPSKIKKVDSSLEMSNKTEDSSLNQDSIYDFDEELPLSSTKLDISKTDLDTSEDQGGDSSLNLEENPLNSSDTKSTDVSKEICDSENEDVVKTKNKLKPPLGKKKKSKLAKKKELQLKNVETYCEICEKNFVRSDSLIKHKRTLTHIAKLSEIEAREAEERAKKVETVEAVEPVITPSPFTLKTNNDTLKLADIISDVLNKPVAEESADLQETKRYKSLGERKSFDSDSLIFNPPATTFNNHLMGNKHPSSTGAFLETQISLLENIIENKGNFSYIDDISNKSDERCSSDMSLVSDIKQDDSNIISFSHNTSIVSSIIHSENNFVKPVQYEEISEDTRNFEEQRARKALNRDEELFLECCSLLKSSSEVSDYSKKSGKAVSMVNTYGIKTGDEPENWLDHKNMISKQKPYPNNDDYLSDDNSRADTPIGDNYDDFSNSNTIRTEWNSKGKEGEFEDISLDSLTNSENNSSFNNFGVNFDGKPPVDKVGDDKELEDDKFDDFMDDDCLDIDDEDEDDVDDIIETTENSQKSKSPIRTTQPPITNFTVPLPKSSDSSTTSDSKKVMTKGAMKVFEGLKVSIPTEELDMTEVLNCSPTTKKTEIDQTPEPKQKELDKEKEIEKLTDKDNMNKFGNKLGLKVTKKRVKPRASQERKLVEEDGKVHDVYDFEETQDNTDLFIPNNLKTFRSQLAEKKEEVSVVAKEVEESDLDSNNHYVDSFSVEAQSVSSFSTETESSLSMKKNTGVKNITKKKCVIMGRIFKNAFKAKTDEIKDIPVVDNAKLVENYVMSCPDVAGKAGGRIKMTEQEMDLLFDKLLEDNAALKKKQEEEEEKEAQARVNVEKAKPEEKTAPVVKKEGGVKGRPKGSTKKKRARKQSQSSDDEFNLNKTVKKRAGRKKVKDNGINLEQELKECMGVAGRKSQRKCTSGKQNVLVEDWSSDDSEFEAMLRLSAQQTKPNPKQKAKEATVETKTSEVVAPTQIENTNSEESKIIKPVEEKPVESAKAIEPISEEFLKEIVKDVAESKPKPRRKSNAKKDKEDRLPKIKPGTIESTLASNRRKRAAADTLYYWSSSSDDDSQNLIEVKSVRDEIDDDEDRPMQHGWIVGDSPKKLVTMLAQAKGKKIDTKCVKEQTKKRTTI